MQGAVVQARSHTIYKLRMVCYRLKESAFLQKSLYFCEQEMDLNFDSAQTRLSAARSATKRNRVAKMIGCRQKTPRC